MIASDGVPPEICRRTVVVVVISDLVGPAAAGPFPLATEVTRHREPSVGCPRLFHSKPLPTYHTVPPSVDYDRLSRCAAAPNDVEYDVTPAQLRDDKFTRSAGDMRKSMETTDAIRKDNYDEKDAVAGT